MVFLIAFVFIRTSKYKYKYKQEHLGAVSRIYLMLNFLWKGCRVIQGDSVARGPKLLSIKNYVIEIMT